MRRYLAALTALLTSLAFSEDVLADSLGYRGATAVRVDGTSTASQRSIERGTVKSVGRTERSRPLAGPSDPAPPVVAFAKPWIAVPWYAFPNHISIRYPSYGFAYGPCGWREPVPCVDD